ncbi:hypothetical protein [Bacillus pumilus]|uniref:hypothetical protein n=1 Tax=Bacillus pumilus TaxID=1408 RepID=UPI0011AA8D7B|nr:hypothetical protein [Bacillus pumilus]
MLNVNLVNKAYLDSELEEASLLNRKYLESDLKDVSLLQLAEDFIEMLKGTVHYYGQGERILIEISTFITNEIKRYLSAVFIVLEREDDETDTVNVELEILRSHDAPPR